MKNTQRRIVSILLVVMLVMLNFTSVLAAETTTYPLLKYGSRGTAVMRLQEALITQGYLSGAADGIYGHNTENAVIKFQTAKRIRIDGIAGNQTQSLLYVKHLKQPQEVQQLQPPLIYTGYQELFMLKQRQSLIRKVAVGNVVINRVN